jgi:hypothetical protein
MTLTGDQQAAAVRLPITATERKANMPNMEIRFYRALRAAKVSEELSQQCVEALENEVSMKIKEATRSLELRLNLLIALTVLSSAIGGYIAYIRH